MKLFRRMWTRFTFVSVAIILQIFIFFFALAYLGRIFPVLYVLFVIFSFMIIVWIGMKNDNPSYKLAWVIIIAILPLFGGVIYLLWGNKRLPKKTKKAAQHLNKVSMEYKVRDTSALEHLAAVDKDSAVTARYVDDVAGFPLWENTEARYYPSGEQMYISLMEELRKAESYIFMEYFIIEEGKMWDPIHELLRRKIRKGVKVYLLYDDMGCIKTLPTHYDKLLIDEGFRVHVVNPFVPRLNPAMNYRDHRKITVVDGRVAFCGGLNLADEYINEKERFGYWKDTAVSIEGDAVWNLAETYIQMWNFSSPNQDDLLSIADFRHTVGSARSDGFVQPFSDMPMDADNVGESFYLNVINHATDYVYITTPYLIIDHEMQTALCLAAKNGVDVRLITPGIPDKKSIFKVTQSYYLPLLEAGVKICEYAPGFIHAKNLISDDKIALVGTINMDYRSFYFHFECGVAFYQSSVIQNIKDDFLRTENDSIEITYVSAKKVSLSERIIRSVLKLFSPVL